MLVALRWEYASAHTSSVGALQSFQFLFHGKHREKENVL